MRMRYKRGQYFLSQCKPSEASKYRTIFIQFVHKLNKCKPSKPSKLCYLEKTKRTKKSQYFLSQCKPSKLSKPKVKVISNKLCIVCTQI